MDTARSNPPLSGSAPAEPVAAIVAQLKHMIVVDLDVPIQEKDIDPAVSLFEGGLALESMVLFQLISLIEKQFGVTFPEENLTSDTFGSLNVLAHHIHEMARLSR